MTEPALILKDVSKTINHTPIVQSISFDVRKGEIFGLLGPNGSGKTTIFRMIVQLIKKTEGAISFRGRPDSDFEYFMRHIGVIIEGPDMYPDMTALQNLKYFTKLRSTSLRTDDLINTLAKVGLEQAARKKVKHFSLGMKQRLGLAYSLLHNPGLLILDEPMNGLDPKGMKELRTILSDLAKQGVSILLSSHLLSEMEEICDRVAYIKKGRILGIEDMKNRHDLGQKKLFTVTVDHPARAKEILEQDGILQVQQKDSRIIELEAEEDTIPYVIKSLAEKEILISRVSARTLSLEEKYMMITDQEDAV
ncbi:MULTISPECIES: ATP-binding cassette domain-containing protein [Bacillus amyloliquefaciens group]|uniref:ATP-binding cassette domain-containing protein n=1 Tax=Bacillus amyloliquefaciens group TaxID=1938374 RepID=UPI001ABC762F|nr:MULTISPECIES: ATP-binding cassette domain-containing protein [Bacillus amyloliquefaciens group]MBO3652212.1 ATP-binding cassette domain-containing protein [Bacillus amyloliquefaciens]MCJ2175033.1 ATP-binding cassette domain-containing protein [Bacillus amyloliquefaciens]MCR4349821.1 ATP-binding cassette domain-containing protein [Bacillus amyloliquefaciens]MCR4358317.1 ATP-binding cassette domain-containing protein [Bacillus amyloliquefaciens]MEC1482288.1 ATP-binding cassette domain-contain